MGRKFKLVKDYYDEGKNIYTKSSVEINPGLTVLVGCNGSGKTTLIRQIKDQLKNKKIPFCEYDNLLHGGSNAISKAGFQGDTQFMVEAMISSEGECINLNFSQMAQKLGFYLRNKYSDSEKYPEFWILLDAVDSGLSVDYVVEYKEFFEFVVKTNINKNIYIVVSANEYEMANGEQCLDVRNCKYITFNDYIDYKKFIIDSRKEKDKRYHKMDLELTLKP